MRTLWQLLIVLLYPVFVYLCLERSGVRLAAPLLLLPVAVSAIGLFVFGSSLWQIPLVEQFARRKKADLSRQEVRYCRTVTLVWCGFFIANAGLSLLLALRGPLWLWSLYTGLLAYLVIAALFVGEWIVRRIRFGARALTPLDELLRRVKAARLRWLRRGMEPMSSEEPVQLDVGAGLWPAVYRRQADPDGCRFEVEVPEQLACWPGHFPGWPVVPGALQLHWVLVLAARWLERPLSLTRIERMKFSSPIGPGQRLDLLLERKPGERVAFRFFDGERLFSSGLLDVTGQGAAEATR